MPPWNENWSVDQAYKCLAALQSSVGFRGIVAFEKDKVTPVGFAAGVIGYDDSGAIFRLEELAVLPEFQRQSIATKLINKLLQLLSDEEQNIDRIYLITELNTPAYCLYQKLGFTQIQRIVMMKQLKP